MKISSNMERALHEADQESLERRIMELALERTGARHGAIFLWDPKAKGLAVAFHIVEGLVVTLPNAVLRRRRDGRPNGIAFHVFETNEPYLCDDTSRDPNYAPYFLDVGSIVAVPITYQERPIGVLSVSSAKPRAFDQHHVDEVEALAASSSTFLRRAQLFRATRERGGRPFMIKGLSPEWMMVERRIEQVAPTAAPVLIQGESGTGKELVANAIHFNSRQSSGPFVTVNCAAIPETLLESTLFGHVRGAFTGATSDKIGEFKKAHGGTLFLDELGELPVPLQAKILRAIELGEVQPIGSNKGPERVDARLVCATNRDLPAMVRERTFREDLYYRLAVMTIELPPLRTYKDENLAVMAPLFAALAAQRHGKHTPRLSEDALALLKAHAFPGNVRELKNALEHAVIMAAGDVIGPEDLPQSMRPSSFSIPPPPLSLRGTPTRPPPRATTAAVTPVAAWSGRTLADAREEWLAPLERSYLEGLLADCRGNVRLAARRADVDAVTLYRLLKKRGLRVDRKVTTAQ